MRRLSLAVLPAILCCIGALPVGADNINDTIVSVQARSTSLTALLNDLAQRVGVGLISEGTDATLVTLSLDAVPFAQCMARLADAYSLVTFWEGNALVARSLDYALKRADHQLAKGSLDGVASLLPAATGDQPIYGSAELREKLRAGLQGVIVSRSAEALAMGSAPPDVAAGLAVNPLQTDQHRAALTVLAIQGYLQQGMADRALAMWTASLDDERSLAASRAWGMLFSALHYGGSPATVAFWQRSFRPSRVVAVLRDAWSRKTYAEGLAFARLNLLYTQGTGRHAEAREVQQAIDTCLNSPRMIDVTCAVDEEALTDSRCEGKIRARVGQLSEVFSKQFGIHFQIKEFIPWRPPSHPGFQVQQDALRAALGPRRPELAIGFILEVFNMRPSEFRPDHRDMWIGYGCPHAGALLLTRDFSFEFVSDNGAQEWTFNSGSVAETLAHEMGHMFGALHVDDPGSLMRAVNSGLSTRGFDEVNRRVVLAQKWKDFDRGAESLDEPELLDLLDGYAALAGMSRAPNGAAQEQARVHLTLAKLYTRRCRTDLADAHLQRVLAIGEPPDVIVHAQALLAGDGA